MSVSQTYAQSLLHYVTVNGREIQLSPRVGKVLTFLLMHGPYHARAELISEFVWYDPDDSPLHLESCISIYIMTLRRAGIEIETEFGRGWRIPEWVRTSAEDLALAA